MKSNSRTEFIDLSKPLKPEERPKVDRRRFLAAATGVAAITGMASDAFARNFIDKYDADGPIARYPNPDVIGFDKRFDPAASTEANVAYLNDQFAHLNNDLELTVAAYNGGESRMARLSRGGERHFWDPSVFSELALLVSELSLGSLFAATACAIEP